MTSLNNFQTFSSQQLRSRWLAVGLFLLALSVAAGHGWLASAGCARFSDLNGTQTMTVILSGLAFTILGALIFFYRPDNRIGWLCLWVGISLSSVPPIHLYVACGLAGHLSLPGLAYLVWFDYSVDAFLVIIPMFILLLML